MYSSLRFTNKFVISLITLSFALFAGCSSDSNPTGGGGGGTTNPIGSPLAAATATVPGPLAAAANANPTSGAALGVSYFNQINSVNNFAGWFTGAPTPVRAQNQAMPAGADTITYMYGGITVSVIINVDTAKSYIVTSWIVILNGSDTVNSYSDFLFITGNYMDYVGGGGQGVARNPNIPGVLAAGFPLGTSQGTMSVYDRFNPQLQGPIVTWNWNSSDAAGANYFHSETAGVVHIAIDTDGSGGLDFVPIGFTGSAAGGIQATYVANWQVDGTGTWTAYDLTGNVDSTGTF